MEKHHTPEADRLFEILLTLESVEEYRAFFEDICTIKELQDISQRLEVADMLHQGKNYQEVSRETGASTATICRVNKCLNYGSGGYRTALSRLDKEDEQ
jgi:TrpR-related protein YerC/YecD